jgi:ABC-type uncharacterized transport system auxiliary subunit
MNMELYTMRTFILALVLMMSSCTEHTKPNSQVSIHTNNIIDTIIVKQLHKITKTYETIRK